jgi:DNA polymerase III epsilon subunit-like protein
MFNSDFTLYVCDTETTALDNTKGDIVELSLYRLSSQEMKTWWLKPLKPEGIEEGALKVNGHKLEDLLHQTAEGKSKYLDPHDVIVDIENWLDEDNCAASQRCLVGQNITFDIHYMQRLWTNCNSIETYPFGRRFMDTMITELMMDFASETKGEGYSLKNLCKKYGVKNDKAHTAEADTKATAEVFLKQMEYLASKLK